MEMCLRDAIQETSNLFQFIVDLLHHTLGSVGLHWLWIKRIQCAQVLFTPVIGDTILRYRNCYDEEFRKKIRNQLPKDILKPIAIEIYVENYMRELFENHPSVGIHEKFFVYCAFLVDLSIFCFRYYSSELIERFVFSVTVVYDNYLTHTTSDHFWNSFDLLIQNVDHMSKGFQTTQLEKQWARHVVADN